MTWKERWKMEKLNLNLNSLRRGDVVFMDLPKNENSSVQYGLRPCVIMSNQKAINSSTVLNVLPITSKNKRCNKLHIPVSHECGLKLDSIVLAEQILTVSKNLIKNKIGKVPDDKMKEINKVVINQLSLV